jgi:hypothetical protein
LRRAYDLIVSVDWLQATVEVIKAICGLIAAWALPGVILILGLKFLSLFRVEIAELIRRGLKLKVPGLDIDATQLLDAAKIRYPSGRDQEG